MENLFFSTLKQENWRPQIFAVTHLREYKMILSNTILFEKALFVPSETIQNSNIQVSRNSAWHAYKKYEGN